MALFLATLSPPLEQLSSERLVHVNILLPSGTLDLLPLQPLVLHNLVSLVELCRLSLHHLLLQSTVLIVYHLPACYLNF